MGVVGLKNGYFQLVNTSNGFGIKIFPPIENGEPAGIGEIVDYLTKNKIRYDVSELKEALATTGGTVLFLGEGECPSIDEMCNIKISEDFMEVTARFFKASETGNSNNLDSIISRLLSQKVVFGVQVDVLNEHIREGIFCTTLVIAKGNPPVPGIDAKIEYYFNTDVRARPTLREDESVDFFHLNTINHCKKGDVLAKIIPEVIGKRGSTVGGAQIKPREPKRATLKYGNNIELAPDHLQILSMVSGHVMLVEGKVFVSDVYVVENVDNSTGNIDFEGSVQVNGNVQSNFSVKANGNVVVNGVVEGAFIDAGGDIIIARGMNGMYSGKLHAGGNIIAKFLENMSAEAEGYISTESILHSDVISGTEIEVLGKRGFITGGHVCAGKRVSVKVLGGGMGTTTVVEVGVNPKLKQQFKQVKKEVIEIQNVIDSTQPILGSFIQKRKKGEQIKAEYFQYIKKIAKLCEMKKGELILKEEEQDRLQEMISMQSKGVVVINGEAYPGTRIAIADSVFVLQTVYKYCKFELVDGEIKMVGM